MASYILGPSNPVPCDNPVVVQCLVERRADGHFPVFPNHPAFTTDVDAQRNLVRSTLCHSEGVSCVEIFCSAADPRFTRDPAMVRFVGVVASLPTPHGTHHGHVSVFVRGAVTMACDITDWRDNPQAAPRAGRFAVEYTPVAQGERRFAGYPVGFTPPVVRPAGAVQCSSMMGTVIEVGRAPSNEVRILLAPEENYANNVPAADAARGVLLARGINEAVEGPPLGRLLGAAQNAAAELDSAGADDDARALRHAQDGRVDGVAAAVVTAAGALLRLSQADAAANPADADVLAEIIRLAA